HPVLLVDLHYAESQPLVEQGARADVLADARHQALEGARAALAREPRQRARPAARVAQILARGPRGGELRAERHHLRHRFTLVGTRLTQPFHILAVHAGEQAYAAV